MFHFINITAIETDLIFIACLKVLTLDKMIHFNTNNFKQFPHSEILEMVNLQKSEHVTPPPVSARGLPAILLTLVGSKILSTSRQGTFHAART
jgi:hypothetical protein